MAAHFSSKLRILAQHRLAPGARVLHAHADSLRAYLKKKARYGFFRAVVYRRYPTKLKGDSYTPPWMGVQIVGADSDWSVANDIDADGDLDVVANDGSLELLVWINDGTGRLTRRQNRPALCAVGTGRGHQAAKAA